MTENGTKSHRDRGRADAVLVAKLASGATQKGAAGAAGVAERTVARRMSDPEFRRQVTEARAEITGIVVERTAQLAGQAMDALSGLLGDDNAQVRLGAARAILTLGAAYGERSEVADRLEALEAVLKVRRRVA